MSQNITAWIGEGVSAYFYDIQNAGVRQHINIQNTLEHLLKLFCN